MAETKPAAPRRDGDLDWIKGIACIFMLMLHAVVMIGVPNRHVLWTVQFQFIHQFYAWFFMASGMNVWRSVSRDMNRDRRRALTSYMLMTAALFGLGIVYSMNRRMLGQMELFQGVAACTAISYLILRRNWPNWSLIVVSVLLFGATANWSYFYYDMLPAGKIDALIPQLFDAQTWHDYPLVINAKALQASFANAELRPLVVDRLHRLFNLLVIHEYPYWKRFLFVHFSLLPWVAWFLLGGVLMRLAGSRHEKWLYLLFGGFLAASFYAPWYVPRIQMDFYFRGKIDFLFWSSGIAGISILLTRRFYKGRLKINKAIEFIGRESFMIFILQWIFVDFVCLPLSLFGGRTGAATWKVFPLAQIGTVLVTFYLARFFAQRRDANILKPSYFRFWGIFTLIFGVVVSATYWSRPILSWFLSYPLIIGVGMLFPAVRLLIRQVMMPKKKQPEGC
ncbi:MAG: hypothetical protein P9L99_03625 [Candidatus Lernaella stagnicola]|nr:hypothetical protein [Candidatus Lernaella stagnicola]